MRGDSRSRMYFSTCRRASTGPAQGLTCLVLACTLLASACAAPAGSPTPMPPASAPVPPTATAASTATPAPTATRAPEPAESFRYDAQAPLEVQELGSSRQGQATVQDIAFTGPFGQVTAYLVLPDSPGPHPAILYVHWLGTEATSNRSEFLPEAVGLAEEGVVSLLVDDLFARPNPRHWWSQKDAAEDRGIVIQQVVELRRALDLLGGLPEVDPQRIAYVGHDFGGMFGALLAGVDPRVKTYVLLTPTADFADWFLIGSSLAGEEEDRFRATLQPLAPVLHVGRATGASVFFQFSGDDRFVSTRAADALFAAAREPKRVERYSWGHGLHQSGKATQDRLAWLRAQLGLPAADAP